MGDAVFINESGGGRRLDSESSRRRLRRSGTGTKARLIKSDTTEHTLLLLLHITAVPSVRPTAVVQ
jgi:hypothetical protein